MAVSVSPPPPPRPRHVRARLRVGETIVSWMERSGLLANEADSRRYSAVDLELDGYVGEPHPRRRQAHPVDPAEIARDIGADSLEGVKIA